MGRLFAWSVGSVMTGAAMLAALPVAAQDEERIGSSFAINAQPAPDGSEQVARPNNALSRIDVRPASAVTLGEGVPLGVAMSFGAKESVPFDAGLQLYGWPERPGLYCDLQRPRGLGASAACLRDNDLDGKFDEGTRIDFNSAKSDILLISHAGKIIGAKFTKVKIALPRPIAYSASQPGPQAVGKLALYWRKDDQKDRALGRLWLSTPDNFTGTAGLSENILLFDLQKLPMDVELYGVKLRLHGLDEKGGLRYSMLGLTDGEKIPLLFRGHRFNIIFI